MSEKNNTCKWCGKKFHYCGSCDFDWILDMGYCSKNCAEHDKMVIKTKVSFTLLVKDLTEEQKVYLATIIDNYEKFSSAGLIDGIEQFVEQYKLDPNF